MSGLRLKVLLMFIFVFAVFSFPSFSLAASSGSSQHCYVSPDFSAYFSSSSNAGSGYVEYDVPCEELLSRGILQKGCCVYKYSYSNLPLSASVTAGYCQNVIGPEASSIFLPGVVGSNCTPDSLKTFDCRKSVGAGKCLNGSIYFCTNSGDLVANCSKCSSCSDAGLECNRASGYCVVKESAAQIQPQTTVGVVDFYGSVVSDKGSSISGASIFMFSSSGSDSYSFSTDSSGNFSFKVHPGEYSVLVSANGYSPILSSVSISQVSSSYYHKFVVSANPSSCDLGLVRFTASNIPGKPWISLSWVVPKSCVGYSVSLLRNGSSLLSNSHVSSFLDKSSGWNTNYRYVLNVSLNNGTSESYSLNVYSGDSICSGVVPGHEFCYDSLGNKWTVGSVLRGTCDDRNKLQVVSSEKYPSNCSTLFNGAGICASAPHYKTICVPPTNCSSLGGPFGLNFNKKTCLAGSNYCYYDYSNTVFDVCYSCLGKSCLDFRSKDACLDNHCGLDCDWIPVNSEFNRGLCLPVNHKPNNACSKCNGLFMNCSAEDCSYLGSCVLNSSDKCLSCPSDMTCSKYLSKSACEGSSSQVVPGCAVRGELVDSASKCCPGLSFLPIYDTSSGSCLITTKGVCTNSCGDGICEENLHENACNCPQDCSSPSTDRLVSYVESECSDAPKVVSFDSCGLGVCSWINNKCVKSSSGSSPDCASYSGSSFSSCVVDVHRPIVSLITKTPILVSAINKNILFKVDSDYPIVSVRYAISKGAACPSSSDDSYYFFNSSSHILSFNVYKYLQNEATNFSGAYNLIFYVKDAYGLGSLPNAVNFYYYKPGLAFSDFSVSKGLDYKSGLFNLLVKVALSKNAVCSYSLKNSSGSVVPQVHVRADDFADEKANPKVVMFDNLTSGNYNIYVNCSDGSTNISYSSQVPLLFNPNFNVSVRGVAFDKLHYGNYPILLNGKTYTVELVYNTSVNVRNFSAFVFSSPSSSSSDKFVIPLKLVTNKTVGNRVLANYSIDLDIPQDYFVRTARSFVLFGKFYVNATKDGSVVDSNNMNGQFFKVVNLNANPIVNIG